MSHKDESGRQIFQFYNAYRLVLIASILIFNPLRFSSGLIHFYLFFFCYAISIILFVYLTHRKKFRLIFLVNLSIICDLIYLNSLILVNGQWSLIAAIFIYVAIAMFSILLPGILAVFYAATESIILIGHSFAIFYLYDINTIYYAGAHGAGLFATSATALVLAQWVKRSHLKSIESQKEINSLHKINDYILHRLHSGVMLVDEAYQVLMMNKQATQMFQLEEGALPDLNKISPVLIAKINSSKQATSIQGKATVFNLKEPESIVHILPDDDESSQRTLLIFEDVAKTKQRAQELKLASLGRFTASIAHELRNPLGAISHAVQLLQESPELDLEDRRLSDIIFSNCNRMNLLIKNILHLSRRKEAKRAIFSARPFFDKIRRESLFYEKMALHIDVSPSDIKIFFDPAHLHQILIILVENSIKYAHVASNQLVVTIKVFTNYYGNVCLQLSDNGGGINDANKDKIFEPFYTTSRQGVGLGLFIAKELCEANQAKIQLLENSQGATFLMTFVDGDVNYG